jgi:hypothetical protein
VSPPDPVYHARAGEAGEVLQQREAKAFLVAVEAERLPHHDQRDLKLAQAIYLG